jgi:chaperonin GroES
MLTPTPGRVLVEKVLKKQEEGGLLIPDSIDKKYYEARILRLGENAASFLRTDDVVLVHKLAGVEVKHDNKDYVIIKPEEVLAVVTRSSP